MPNDITLNSVDRDRLSCFLKTKLDDILFDIPLTVKINWPENWLYKSIQVIPRNTYHVFSLCCVDSVSTFDIYANEKLDFYAYEK